MYWKTNNDTMAVLRILKKGRSTYSLRVMLRFNGVSAAPKWQLCIQHYPNISHQGLTVFFSTRSRYIFLISLLVNMRLTNSWWFNFIGASLDPQDISVRKYKAMLWQVVKDILEILNCDLNALEQELRLANKISGLESLSNEETGAFLVEQ